MNANNPLG